MDYKIELYPIPSNLGRGEVLYFVCPGGGGLCKILYLAPGSHKFMSRNYYYGYDPQRRKYTRLYYPLQISSKPWMANSQYWGLEKKLNALYEMRATDTYKGLKTRRAERIQWLEGKKDSAHEADMERLAYGLYKVLGDLIPKDLGLK